MIGRCLPNGNNSYGLFEFEQAKMLVSSGLDVVYGYSDNRSIRFNRVVNTASGEFDGVRFIGKTLPIGGLPLPLVDVIKTHSLRSEFNQLAEAGWIPDVVYAHFPLLALTESFVHDLKTRGIPFVCMEHWSRVQTQKLNAHRRSLLKTCVDSAASFCWVGEDLRESVCSMIGIDRESIRVIPNMIDERVFYPSSKEPIERQVADPFTLLVCGRLVASKSLDLIIEAFSDYSKQNNAELLIVGDGSYRCQLEELAKGLGLGQQISFLGWSSPEEVADLMRKTDCYISASSVETFGTPFAEAWMCGTPCIGPDNNPLRKYFNQSNGFLFKAKDKESLIEAMVSVAELCKQGSYSPKAISSAASVRFSQSAVIERVISELEAAVEANPISNKSEKRFAGKRLLHG